MSNTEPNRARSAAPVRKVLRCRARLQLSDGKTFDVRTLDITGGGISVMAQHGFNAGELCSLVFESPINGALQTFTAEVKIVYATRADTDGTRLGLRFMSADPLRTQLIESLY